MSQRVRRLWIYVFTLALIKFKWFRFRVAFVVVFVVVWRLGINTICKEKLVGDTQRYKLVSACTIHRKTTIPAKINFISMVFEWLYGLAQHKTSFHHETESLNTSFSTSTRDEKKPTIHERHIMGLLLVYEAQFFLRLLLLLAIAPKMYVLTMLLLLWNSIMSVGGERSWFDGDGALDTLNSNELLGTVFPHKRLYKHHEQQQPQLPVLLTVQNVSQLKSSP